MVLGIDVSAWQRSISWKAVKDAGVEFGFVKATDWPSVAAHQYTSRGRIPRHDVNARRRPPPPRRAAEV